MKSTFLTGLLAITTMVVVNQDVFGQQLNGIAAETPASFTGEKTSWHGFDRFDFLMDDAALTVQPIKASPDEETGINAQVKGILRCIAVVPKEAAPGKPWSWRGRYFDHEPQAEIELLKRGFHIGFIQDSEEDVNQINQRLRDDGYQVPKPARLHGSWTFYFQAPGGFTVEVLR